MTASKMESSPSDCVSLAVISLCAVSGGDADNDLGSLQLIGDGIRRLEGSPLLLRWLSVVDDEGNVLSPSSCSLM